MSKATDHSAADHDIELIKEKVVSYLKKEISENQFDEAVSPIWNQWIHVGDGVELFRAALRGVEETWHHKLMGLEFAYGHYWRNSKDDALEPYRKIVSNVCKQMFGFGTGRFSELRVEFSDYSDLYVEQMKLIKKLLEDRSTDLAVASISDLRGFSGLEERLRLRSIELGRKYPTKKYALQGRT